MKSLVIGGAGFIGSNMVDRLEEVGQEIVIVDNLSTGCIENVPNHYVYVMDVENVDKDFYDILMDAEYVFFFAAKARVQPSIENPMEFHETNVNGLLNVLEVLKKSIKLKKFIFSSSSSVYGDQDTFPTIETAPKNPVSPYGLQKLIGEQYVKLYADLYKLPTVSLRYFNVFGDRMTCGGAYGLVIGIWLDLVNKGKPITINGDGKQRRDFTFVEDIVNANLRVATDDKIHSGEAFNIGNGNPISVNEVAQIFQCVTKCDKIYLPAVIEPFIIHADNHLAKKMFGWEPTVSLEDWLPIYIERNFKEKINEKI